MEMYSYHMTGFPALLVMVLGAVVLLLPFYKLWQRTGHSGWIALLMVIPVVNLILLYVLAFKDWPALDDERGR
ncbi:hypothetical protein [Thalassovita taeanensis]|uniref:Uncharacterized protein n=1 Tax=Thalassovita taeanensis TaxID=657014 RepID=A0A1H9FPE3_9RHOB|nr:hypothetical protein [Thalassovita taeanensis]SEQ39699.1 hypothetical protein SAMN04488092_106163 [Thalassovita taeanensis]